MIVLNKLTKKFNNQIVVNNISLKIKEGEIIGLLGPNGAGKTTTLRMIAGVLPPSSGSIEINGQNVIEDDQIKQKIGFLPENNPLYEDLTVEEFLSFWANIKQIPTNKKAEAIEFVVRSCSIAEVFYRPINELSKGYRQRVGLAQAILTKPDVLILDEPTEGLDPNQRQEIASLIRELGKRRTVIISSHVLSELAKIATRMIIIHRGEVVADNTPENLRKVHTGYQLIEFEVRGKSVIPTLKKLAEIIDIKEIKKNYYQIEANSKEDLRPRLYNLAVTNNWELLTLFAREKAIEDVFSELTSQ